ncbi:ATP-binding protein [Streptococcus constellatus]|uniref:ATP-binding protein n=1 Tax=Streptococcus constellatus TaxID=76860 RepID=UPI001C55E707|nr:ATP-binding protein [Streptococcus constellatus]MBW3453264.1 ATP-binding protein [Streptococcus constellatus]
MTVEKIDLQIAYGAVKHFGRNLYTSNPPAITELIANSWDAYCTECSIFYTNLETENNAEKSSLLIFDNGIGMTDSELVERYAISGTEKNLDCVRIPEGKHKRPYMGRKGIGKFSAFSLGDEYILYTKSSEDKQWKKLRFEYDLLNKNEAIIPVVVEYINDLNELKSIFANLNVEETGTAVYIPSMRRKIISSSINGLKNLISRRFSVGVINNHEFSLKINNELVDLTQHFYDKNLEFVYYFGLDLNVLKTRFPKIPLENFHEVNDTFFEENSINGWLGTVEMPRHLWADENTSVSGVVVYINGKLADEDILKDKLKNRVSNSYALGEVNADFLQNETEDPVLSSREGLNKEIQNVNFLIERLYVIRNKIDTSWSELRTNRTRDKHSYLDKMLELDSDLNSAFKFYNDSQQKQIIRFSQKVFDNDEEHSNSEYRVYGHAIFALVNNKVINEIEINDTDDFGEVLKKVYNLFEKTELNAALRIKSNIEDRISVINKLKKIIDQEEVEAIFEEHLAKNPWLINQYWDKPSKEIVIETQNRYRSIIQEEEVSGRTDIIIRVADEPFPVICELKREKLTGYSTPKISEIKNQIYKYRRFIAEEVERSDKAIKVQSTKDIKAYFICGEAAYNKLKPLDLNELRDEKIEIKTYQDIIKQVERVYSDRINIES